MSVVHLCLIMYNPYTQAYSSASTLRIRVFLLLFVFEVLPDCLPVISRVSGVDWLEGWHVGKYSQQFHTVRSIKQVRGWIEAAIQISDLGAYDVIRY